MTDTVIASKAESIERCLQRIQTSYAATDNFEKDYDRQDAIILNLQRACEACIDIAAHIARVRKLGIAKTTAMLFELLSEDGLISEQLAKNLISMVGFRNLAIHEYTKVNLMVVKAIVEEHLGDFEQFVKAALMFD